MRRIFALMLILALCITMFPVYAGAAADKPSAWAKPEVDAAIKTGIVPKTLQSKYQTPITREEFAQLLVQAALINTYTRMVGDDTPNSEKPVEPLTADKLATIVKSPAFEDTKSTNVRAAYILGFINGVSATRFAPNDSITREQAATMMANYSQSVEKAIIYKDTVLAYPDWSAISTWAREAVDVCNGSKIMLGTSRGFEPKAKYTREQAICCIQRAFKSFEGSVNLRGNVTVDINDLSEGWEVGKDFVLLHKNGDTTPLTDGEKALWKKLCEAKGAEYYVPTRNQYNLYKASKSSLLSPVSIISNGKYFTAKGDILDTEWNGAEFLIKYTIVSVGKYVSHEDGVLYLGRERKIAASFLGED